MTNILFDKLPWLYEQSGEVQGVQASIESERVILDSKFKDLYKQVFIESADWSLTRWETMLGIKKLASRYSEEDYQSRRENILVKLRSKGVTSKSSLEELCRTFSGGDVKILEDNANYFFMVKFISEESIPSNLDGLTRAVEEVKPAHLAWDYILAYNIWLQSLDKTWELNAETWGDDKTADFIDTDMKAICSNNTICSTILVCGNGA